MNFTVITALVWWIFTSNALFTYVCAMKSGHVTKSNQRKGCIVTLARGYEDTSKYNETIIKRNKSIRDYLYSSENAKRSVADVIIFHEGNIMKDHQMYIQSETLDMPIIFVNISRVFHHFNLVSNSQCPPTSLSNSFAPGYKSMCYFWFIGFKEYVREYDWMLRLDADCTLRRDCRKKIYNMPEQVHFASTKWSSLKESGHADQISEKEEGPVVVGLRNFTIEFAINNNIPGYINSWEAPYSNVMYINLNWLRNHTVINNYMVAVEKSGCIYANRWGDLPLWGAAILLAREQTAGLNVSYHHGSHNTDVV